MDIPRFTDVSERKSLDGDKVKIDDLLNQEIIVTGYQVASSKYKNKGAEYCTKVQFYYALDETKTMRVFFSGSSVIKDQIEDMEKQLSAKEMPFLFATIVKKVGNYYSFT